MKRQTESFKVLYRTFTCNKSTLNPTYYCLKSVTVISKWLKTGQSCAFVSPSGDPSVCSSVHSLCCSLPFSVVCSRLSLPPSASLNSASVMSESQLSGRSSGPCGHSSDPSVLPTNQHNPLSWDRGQMPRVAGLGSWSRA